mmetsp:Transcript_94410/g.177741  ORF Transcript_94410/g.177741 Transcript_94410/m.177741 type:complete len:407 (+) Transcript_94410:134-1354(+)
MSSMAEELPPPSDAKEVKTVPRRSKVSSLERRRLTIDCRINELIELDIETESHHVTKKKHPAEEPFTPGAVVSIWGKETTEKDVFQPYFSEKAMNYDGNEQFRKLPHSVGLLCQRGHKPDSPNQDDFFVLARQQWLIFGVLDGHGPMGHHVSHYVQEHLPCCILDRMKNSEDDWDASARAAFEEVTQKLGTDIEDKVATSGSTATVALLSRDISGEGPLRLRCAFIGDSSIVHGWRNPDGGSWEVKLLSNIHRPDREDEAARIISCGGEVMASPGPGFPPRLMTPFMDLAMSRSFGDFYARGSGLISTPEVPEEVVLEENLDHIILVCSDGIWDVIEPVQAVQLVAKFSPAESQKAAEKLAHKAQHRWQEQEGGGVVDDISVILVRPGFAAVAESPAEESASASAA